MRLNRVFLLVLVAGLGVEVAQTTRAAEVALVQNGKSAYRVYLDKNAPGSVRTAAQELRRYVQKATGAELKVEELNGKPHSPFISLGDTSAARAAGLSAEALPPDGYRIITKDGNLFIVGSDTPGGKLNATGGVSTGTRNGVYDFLERVVGVRWLMPGPDGEDVPHHATLTLPSIDRTDAPAFASRTLPYVQESRKDVRTWLRRMRLGKTLSVSHSHNWTKTIPAAMYKAHPDWFAEIGGKRVKPTGRYKLETTNPQLQAEFARRAIEALKKNPHRYSYSLSPSDGSPGWSQSAATKALEEKDPNGNLSRTPLILNFYNEVAKRVRQAMPDRIVAGYIYASYLYPPKMPVEPLQPNLFLVVAPSFDYGNRLYRPDVQKEFEYVMEGWSKRTGQLGYYDLPVHLIRAPGLPQGPGIEILQFIYPKLKNYGVKLVYVYGHPGWGGAAIGNYLLAKLAWNPNADIRALANDFYRRAYGPQAGPIVGRMYDQLDQTIKAYYLKHENASYTVTPEILKGVYGAWYPQAEKEFAQAKSSQLTQAQSRRLEMLGQSLMLVGWHLRRFGDIPADPHSPLYRSNEQIERMLRDPANELALSPVLKPEKLSPIPKLSIHGLADVPASAQPQASAPFTQRNDGELLLYSPTDTTVTVSCPTLQPTTLEVMRYRLRDPAGKVLGKGVVHQGAFLTFPLKAGQHVFLQLDLRASYQLRVEGCDYAFGVPQGKNGVEILQSTPDLYFYIPSDGGKFSVVLTRDSLGYAVADLFAPDGKKVGTMDGRGRHVATVDVPANQAAGVWRIAFRKEESKTAYALWVRLEGSTPSWFSTNPQRVMKIMQ